ncbi:RsmE family RNA methyltransferase [Acidobacteriota bacterium]
MSRERRFYIETLPESGAVELSGNQARHGRTILRLKPGNSVVLFDSKGRAMTARVEECRQGKVILTLLEEIEGITESPLRIVIYQAIVRPAAMEKLIVMCSEIGARTIIPMMTARCRSKRPGAEKLARWKRLAIESAKQCNRSNLLRIGEPVDFSKLDFGALQGRKLILHPGWGTDFSFNTSSKEETVILLIGPEGGWEPAEMDCALEAGFTSMGLGPRILRSETAAVAAAAIFQHLFGDLG